MEFEIRASRAIQGRKKLGAERTAYLELMRQGVGNAEACRVVGVNQRTGTRWRYGGSPQGGKADGAARH